MTGSINNKTSELLRHSKVLLQPVAITFYFACLCLALLYSTNTLAVPKAQKILIVHQKAHDFSQKIYEQLNKNTKLTHYHIDRMELHSDQVDIFKLNNQDLLISIGSKTSKALLDAKVKTPVLSVLIPRHFSESYLKSSIVQENWSSLVIDHPIERHFHLITAIMGKQQKTGILLGPYTKNLEKPLEKAAKKTRHKVSTEYIEDIDQLTSSLKNITNFSDVLLTLPDPVIYNKNTIRGILFSSYRKKLPIIGFSRAYVKAGAVAAIYSEPEQISIQAANIARDFLVSGSFKQKTFYPDNFSVALNKKVAKSLGIRLSEESAITKQIRKAEKK